MNMVFESIERTNYGVKCIGKSRFVVIAPHAGGDDLKTGIIAREIARRLDGFFIVNYRYFKPTNSKAARKPDFVEDFNKLYWSSKKGRYFWGKKKPAMKQFFDDIAGFCDNAQQFTEHGKAVAVYIHGMNCHGVGLDIGVGLRAKKDKNRFIGSDRSDYYCSGVPTIPIRQLKSFKNILQSSLLKDYNLPVGIGRQYPAWSKRIAVQLHKHCGRSDYAMQIEIAKELREEETMLIYICNLLARSLKQTFI